MQSNGRSSRIGRAAGVAAACIAWASCEAEPTKSQYVSSVVRRECTDLASRRDCRIAVIKAHSHMTLEELKSRYPEPAPPQRPSCSLW